VIISHKHEFVFTSPLKVGSSTAQATLLGSNLLGEGDYHSGCVENIADRKIFDIADSLPTDFFKDDNSDSAKLTAKARLTHATPSVLFDMGLLTEQQLNDYLFVSIVRNPIERYISAWLLDGGGTLEGLIFKIDNGLLPQAMSFSCPKDYFYHQDKRLNNIKILCTQTLDDSLPSFVRACGGSVVYPKRIKQSAYPEWAKRHYSQWLPLKQLKALYDLLADEIEFYHLVTGRDL